MKLNPDSVTSPSSALQEEIARQAELLFRQMADSMPQMVWRAGTNGLVNYFNRRWVEYTGVDSSTPLARWEDVIHPEDIPWSRAIWQQCLITGHPYNVEYRIKHLGTGHYRWFLARALPVKDSNGNITHWFGTCTDIHDQRMATENLRLQAQVLQNMEEGVSISDEDGYILYTNSAEDSMFAYAPGELIGKHVTVQNDYEEEENKRMVAGVIEQLKREGYWSGEWRNIRKDGTRFFTYSRITNLRIRDKNFYVCIQRDITEEKRQKEALLESEQRFRMLSEQLERRVEERTRDLLRANRKLERSNKELEEFAYVASHDLQEPLRKIKAFGDMLIGKHADSLDRDGTQIIERMQSASMRMKDLIEDLLTYSRVSRQLNMEIVDLNAVLQEVLGDLDATVREKQAEIMVEGLIPMKADPLQMRQLFQNLLSNALKFTRDKVKPVITVKSHLHTDPKSGIRYQAIEVRDNGIGFEQQYAGRIFQVFQRLHGRAEYPGSGVGLSIVQKVVENHNGYIQAEGEPGEGACFKVFLPLE